MVRFYTAFCFTISWALCFIDACVFLFFICRAGTEPTSRKKVKVDILKKFLEPSFSMFENIETQVTVDEYGASIDDLQFKDIQTIDTKW